MIFMEILVFGLFKGAIYALIAVGFTLIFGVARVINLGHGTFYMLGAYLTYVFIAYAGLNPFLSLAISAIVVGFVGVSMDYILIRPMREMGAYVTVVTLAFALLSQYIIFAIFGSRARNIPDFVTGNVVVFGDWKCCCLWCQCSQSTSFRPLSGDSNNHSLWIVS